MDESIGAKGGYNDYRRSLIITKKTKKKLEKYQKQKEIEDLEKEIKKKQTFILIKTLPILLVGKTIQELTEKNKTKEIINKDNKKEVTIILNNSEKEVVNIPINKNIENILIDRKTQKEIIKSKEKDKVEQQDKVEEKVKEVRQNDIIIPKTKEKKLNNIDINTLNEKQRKKLEKLETRKIVEVYEEELKEIRYELRNLVFDYNVLVDENETIVESKEIENILDRLNDIIIKIEKLKDKIRIEDLDKYDDNYIYTLIEEYIRDFKDKKVIEEIKDSKLYILISEKLDELDDKKDNFKKCVEDKKEELIEREEKFDELKEKYYKIENINKSLEDFQKEQELLLKELQIKIDNAVTVTEKVEVQVNYMDMQARNLLRRLSILLFLPGARAAKAFAATASLYTHYAKQMLKEKPTTKKYKVIKVSDYSKDIENNIEKINNVETILRNTSKDIDKIILNVKEEFKDYIGILKECDELLSNLEKVKSNIHEKEFELEKIKQKTEKELERNNAKILIRK